MISGNPVMCNNHFRRVFQYLLKIVRTYSDSDMP